MIQNQMPGQPYGGYPPAQVVAPAVQEWSTGLCGCCDDCGICCFTVFCPCCQYGKNYEAVHGSGCCSQGFVWCILAGCYLSCCVHTGLRKDVRQRYNIPEGSNDCCTVFWCGPCAVCQEARQLKNPR